jgi:hypothetical protein
MVIFRVVGLLAIGLAGTLGRAQQIQVKPVVAYELPPVIDGNTAAFWRDGVLTIFHSDGNPTISRGPSQFDLSPAIPVDFKSDQHRPVWFEAVWQDSDGTLFLWYHHEPKTCENGLVSPKIGAAISRDGGLSVEDLGIVLEAGDSPNCSAQNGFFSSGHGDMSAVFDETSGYFYFFFTNYGGPLATQGVVTARMALADRFEPAGKVHKFYNGTWQEPGLGGLTTPIFAAKTSWAEKEADSYWGPSVHWNTHLRQWVMLLNHACCYTGWPQRAIRISFNTDLAAAGLWKQAVAVLDGDQLPDRPAFYPQILGLDEGGTDTRGGQVSRLYVQGVSRWELILDPEAPRADEILDDSVSPKVVTKPSGNQ